MNIEELAADVRPTGDLGNALAVEPVEPGIAIGMKITPEPGEMHRGALRLAIGCIAEQHSRGRIAGITALVTNIGPEPTGPGATRAAREHRHRRVVGMQRRAAHHVPFERVDQRVEEPGRAPHPIGQRGAGEIDALPGIDARLAIEREVVGVLGHQHMREQPGTGTAALDRHGGHRHLDDALTRAAAETWSDVAHDAERGRDVVELLGYVLAHAPHGTAAIGTHARRLVQNLLARQMLRKRLAMWLGGVASTRNRGRDLGRRFGFGLFQSEFQLVGFAGKALGRAAKRHAPEPGDLHAKLFQLCVRDDEHGLEQLHVVGQRGGIEQHDRLYQSGIAHARENRRKACFLPRQRRLGRPDRVPPVHAFKQHR